MNTTILDTEIHASDINIRLMKAFLYGALVGEYTLYKHLSSDCISINFSNSEDATMFKLKDMELKFTDIAEKNKDPHINYTGIGLHNGGLIGGTTTYTINTAGSTSAGMCAPNNTISTTSNNTSGQD